MDEKNALSEEGRQMKKIGKTPLIAAAGVLGALIVGFGAVCGVATAGDKIAPHVTVGGVDVGGMTLEQAERSLAPVCEGLEQTGSLAFTVDGETAAEISYRDLGARFEPHESAAGAWNWSHGGNFLRNGARYLGALFGRNAEFAPMCGIAEDEAAASAERVAATLDRSAQDFSYEVRDDGLYMTKARDGMKCDRGALAQVLSEALNGGSTVCDVTAYETIPAEKGNLEALKDAFSDEGRNAYYDSATDTILPEQIGVVYDPAQAQSMLDAAQDGDTVLITADVEYPAVTKQQLEGVLFRDVLGSYTTKVGGAAGRHKNVQLTASRINGYVMNSGETIRYGALTTPFTLANGYYMAPMYVQGKTVDGAGGGACQASSTLYAAAILANLEIVQRTNHGYASDYIGLGLDATVASGGPELEIRNNTNYPIRVQATFYNQNGKDYVTVKLLGTKVDDTYVKVRTAVLSTTPFEEQIIETDELAPGQRVVEQTAYTGYLVKTYRQLYKGDGTLISETLEATSKYNARNRIIKVGKSADPVVTPTDPVVTPTDPAVTPTDPAVTPTDPVVPPADPVVTPPDEPPVEPPAEQPPVEPPAEAVPDWLNG